MHAPHDHQNNGDRQFKRDHPLIWLVAFRRDYHVLLCLSEILVCAEATWENIPIALKSPPPRFGNLRACYQQRMLESRGVQ
jgi:hypothetical protein